jgi:hypothetical protein
MSITINLAPDEERKLLERAARNGQDVTAYVHRLIERDINDVEEALAPFRSQIAESGISDDELGSFFEEVREEVWQEKHGRPSKTS